MQLNRDHQKGSGRIILFYESVLRTEDPWPEIRARQNQDLTPNTYPNELSPG